MCINECLCACVCVCACVCACVVCVCVRVCLYVRLCAHALYKLTLHYTQTKEADADSFLLASSWIRPPVTVNAFYSPIRNDVIFPIAMFHLPYYIPNGPT